MNRAWGKLGIGGLIDLAHAPLTDESTDVVVAEAGADLEGYELLGLNLGSFYAQAMADSTFLAGLGGHEGVKGVNKQRTPHRPDVVQANSSCLVQIQWLACASRDPCLGRCSEGQSDLLRVPQRGPDPRGGHS